MGRLALRRWLAVLGCWTAIGVIFSVQEVAASRQGAPIQIGRILGTQFSCWYLWALLTPAVVWLTRRFPIEPRSWIRSILIHGAAGVAAVFLHVVFHASLDSLGLFGAGRRSSFGVAFRNYLIWVGHFEFLTYWTMVAVILAIGNYRRYRERELKASQLESSLTQARLQALRMQLNPHFLFNTLNAIASLIHQEPDAADSMITRLAGLLRQSLAGPDRQELPLKEELDLVRRYVDIEKVRFGDRISVRFDIAPETLDAQCPNFFLQPLVENAIRHGLAPRASGGSVEIRARRVGDNLVVSIVDDGVGMRKSPDTGGVGLSNTCRRLDELYGADTQFRIFPVADGGTAVEVVLPFRQEPGTEQTRLVG